MARDIEYKRERFLRGDKVKRVHRKNVLPTPEECFKLVQSGRSIPDLSREYGCSMGTIDSKVRTGRAIVLEGRMPRRGHRASIPEILSAYKDGSTVEEITQEAGRSLAFIHCVLQEHGLLPKETATACDVAPSEQEDETHC
jgi:hypothetical protein